MLSTGSQRNGLKAWLVMRRFSFKKGAFAVKNYQAAKKLPTSISNINTWKRPIFI
jgi:hypothetical protein